MALDFIAGCIGGCAGVIVGHPLDTVKIHLQTQTTPNSTTYTCLRSIVAKEGARGLLRGLSSPLASVAAINAIVFGIYGNAQRHFDMSALSSHFLAGGAAGLLQSPICSPMELAKSRAQVSATPTTPLACLRAIHRQHGLRAVFRGLGVTAVREVPGFGTYFLAYEYCTRGGAPASTGAMLLAGGLAGVASWVAVYPVDLLKSRLQLDDLARPRYASALDCLRQAVRAGGWASLYRGLAPTVLRAFPVNAATFTVVAWSARLLEGEVTVEGWSEALVSMKVSDLM